MTTLLAHLFFLQPTHWPYLLVQLAAQEEIAPNAHQGHKRQVLIDRLDAKCPCVCRRIDDHPLPVKYNLAPGRRMDSGKHLDQRRFSSAVVAHQRPHLPFAHSEVDAAQGHDRTKAPFDLFHFHHNRLAVFFTHSRNPSDAASNRGQCTRE